MDGKPCFTAAVKTKSGLRASGQKGGTNVTINMYIFTCKMPPSKLNPWPAIPVENALAIKVELMVALTYGPPPLPFSDWHFPLIINVSLIAFRCAVVYVWKVTAVVFCLQFCADHCAPPGSIAFMWSQIVNVHT